MANRLAILAGRGPLPEQLIAHCRRTGRDCFVLAFERQTEPSLLADVPHAWTRVGAADEVIDLLKAHNVGDVVMAGWMRRPSLAEIRPDRRAARILARIGLAALGDDGFLKVIKAELESEGFRLVGVDEVVDGLLAIEGAYGRHLPDATAEADIAHGLRVVRGLGMLDIGQAAVVQQGLVLGVEAIEGTDALIARCGLLRRDGPGGVLVKAPKPSQDRRIDLPTIGPETVACAAAAGLSGIAVEAGGTLVIDPAGVIEAADRLGLFVIARRPDASPPLFYLIAGEPSGDAIGASLMQALRLRTGGSVRFAGIGGERMEGLGLVSLVPIRELAIMGVLEVVPAARRVLRRVRETVTDIERLRPDAVITIDSSGFCFRVAERLRRKPAPVQIIHYVAPMVWAWRPYRAKYAARAADHLLTLLPFEPPYFAAVGLAATYVGHPVVEGGAGSGDGPGFRRRHGIAADATVLCVLPGSRRGEIRRLLPVFGPTVARLRRRWPGLVVVVPTVDTVADEVTAVVATWPGGALVIRGTAEKFDAFAASDVALAASGTVSLELAMAKVPMVIAYRIWLVTGWVLDRVKRVPYATLVSILLNRQVVPELLQADCTPERLETEVARLLTDPDARRAQTDAFDEALTMIGKGGERPSLRAADKILELVAARARN